MVVHAYILRLTVLTLSLFVIFGQAQETSGKYEQRLEDTLVTVFLQEANGQVDGALMFGYGLLLPLEVERVDDLLHLEAPGTDPPLTLEGRLTENALQLVLDQNGQRTELALERVTGAGPELAAPTPLLQALELVPDVLVARQGTPGVSFVDLRAVEAAHGLESPGTAAAYQALSESARETWNRAMSRAIGAPQDYFAYLLQMIESMPDLVGFEFFDTSRVLGYGEPPNQGLILAAAVDPERLAERLSTRGFAQTQWQEVPIWHFGEDGSMNVSRREPADPFLGNLGLSTRVAVLPGFLARSRSWFMAHKTVDAFADRYPSLADASDYRTLADAVGDPTSGTVLQAVFLHPLEVGAQPMDPAILLEPEEFRERLREELAPPDPGTELPLYGLALLADRQEGAEQVHMIALLYEDPATAQLAAQELSRRLAIFEDPIVLESRGVRLDEPRVYQSEAGLAAAIASLRYPLPGAGEDAEPPGAVFRAWLNAVYVRQFPPLVIGPAR